MTSPTYQYIIVYYLLYDHLMIKVILIVVLFIVATFFIEPTSFLGNLHSRCRIPFLLFVHVEEHA